MSDSESIVFFRPGWRGDFDVSGQWSLILMSSTQPASSQPVGAYREDDMTHLGLAKLETSPRLDWLIGICRIVAHAP